MFDRNVSIGINATPPVNGITGTFVKVDAEFHAKYRKTVVLSLLLLSSPGDETTARGRDGL